MTKETTLPSAVELHRTKLLWQHARYIVFRGESKFSESGFCVHQSLVTESRAML